MILSQATNKNAVNAYYPTQSVKAAQSFTAIKITDLGADATHLDVANLDWHNLDAKNTDLQFVNVGIVVS